MKMSRSISYIFFITVIFTSVLFITCRSEKSGPYTVGVVNALHTLDGAIEGFKDGMKDLDYLEGKNISYIYHGAVKGQDTLKAAVEALLDAKVDLILSITTPATLAAKKATAGTGLPVVFAIVTDPPGSGIVESIPSTSIAKSNIR
jgi:putative ABC transport system substrate-binding protein